ncbi:hypothetical protein [Defluviimonas salinarum]|uniref:Uncharacterized protein n=1 Tax=Defluviimonas salinarum TaxID=2992147 RepID=A0ABT3J530_9RHOB|nr:hypothetical protein [Defluviimonas salinarum]MCW3782514.1 hypothetical protein [Defluviimonas salinarum]
MRIDYLSSNETEPDIRLSDAMLYAALRQELGEMLELFDERRAHDGSNPLWGRDRYRILRCRIEAVAATYAEPAVMAALGDARIVAGHRVQGEMDRLSGMGRGAILRNMRDPAGRLRYTQAGDRYDQHRSAIGADAYTHDILVQPNLELEFSRRYLVVAGEIAAETPIRFCEAEPLLLLDPLNRNRQARDPWSALEAGDSTWPRMQRKAAEALLADYRLVSGSIDVGLALHLDGSRSAHVEAVTACRPGDSDIYFADASAYARKIAAHLAEIEPSLREHPEP